MLVKFFKPTLNKGATGGIDYLLGDKDRSVSPELLSGNPDVTRQLLMQSQFKNQYTTGCLSFDQGESDISKDLQCHLMQSFEEMLMSGLDASQYDILWIKHTDKNNRLELNFHIVNTELTTGKRLQPYLHKFDLGRVEAWKSLQNDLHNLADPNAPERARILQRGNNSKSRNELKTEIHNYLENCWIHNEINNRNDLINELNKLNIEITRTTKKAISIKVPEFEKPIRLNGELYNDDLTTCEKFTERQEEKQGKYDKERGERIERNREKLESLTERIAKHRQRKYSKINEEKRELNNFIDNSLVYDFGVDLDISFDYFSRDNQLLQKHLSRVRESETESRPKDRYVFDKVEVKKQLKKVENNERADRDFTQRIRKITNAVRLAIQELRETFRAVRETPRTDDKLREIYRDKRAQRLDILDNDARAAAQRVCSLQSREVEHPERSGKPKKSSSELAF
ncbi:relaxase [Vibrio cholerae]